MLELKNITKQYNEPLLANINIVFEDTGFIGIKGKSGCGKSTLLHIIGMLDHDYEGKILFNNEEIKDKQEFIRTHISFIMQSHDYINSLTVKENIILPSYISSISNQELIHITDSLNITHLLKCYPKTLSGGELKRMSIAKALYKRSSIILCDEPTGALDYSQSIEIMNILKQLSTKHLIIIVSHNHELLETYCDHILTIEDRQLKGTISAKDKIEYKADTKKKRYPWFYPLKSILYHKNKYAGLFIIQWIITLCFILLLTCMNGFIDMIETSSSSHPLSNIITIENKDHTPFLSTDKLNNYQYCDYSYDLSYLSSQYPIDTYSLLPVNTEHIKLIKGTIPKNNNEILISKSLSKAISTDTIDILYNDKTHTYKVTGIIEDYFIPTKDLYFINEVKTRYSDLINPSLLTIEVKPPLLAKTLESLNKTYITYSDINTQKESYSTLLNMSKNICYIFMIINIIISLLLIYIVFTIIFNQRTRECAYLYSLGMNIKDMKLLFISETLTIGLILFTGGMLISLYAVNLINETYILKEYYHVILSFKKLFIAQYDIYIILAFLYLLISYLSSKKPIHRLITNPLIESIKEE